MAEKKVNKKKFVRYKEGADIIIVNHVVQVVSLKNSRTARRPLE